MVGKGIEARRHAGASTEDVAVLLAFVVWKRCDRHSRDDEQGPDELAEDRPTKGFGHVGDGVAFSVAVLEVVLDDAGVFVVY